MGDATTRPYYFLVTSSFDHLHTNRSEYYETLEEAKRQCPGYVWEQDSDNADQWRTRMQGELFYARIEKCMKAPEEIQRWRELSDWFKNRFGGQS